MSSLARNIRRVAILNIAAMAVTAFGLPQIMVGLDAANYLPGLPPGFIAASISTPVLVAALISTLIGVFTRTMKKLVVFIIIGWAVIVGVLFLAPWVMSLDLPIIGRVS